MREMSRDLRTRHRDDRAELRVSIAHRRRCRRASKAKSTCWVIESKCRAGCDCRKEVYRGPEGLGAYHRITHKAGTLNGKADALSHQSDHQVGDEDNNTDQMVLKPEHFHIASTRCGHASVTADQSLLKRIRECSDKDQAVAKALEKVQNLGPPQLQKGFDEWNAEQGLLLFRGMVYVPKNAELQWDIVKIHHDSPIAGHGGRAKTLELVSWNYWWPGMSKLVNKYVSTCNVCNHTKTFPAKPQGLLKPNGIPERLWQIITTDMIIGLPKSDGFDLILVTTNRFTKQVHFSACHETLTAEGVADLYICDVFKHHGAPAKVISDRGPQFASKYLHMVYKCRDLGSSGWGKPNKGAGSVRLGLTEAMVSEAQT
ncbi:hypothetical protein IEO21_10721 [Rhodonia placenta]|uniref:Integrase zinc-binding domain-containing protein n=1 Tax=Rhodonia placenta TaxID=104341 RepID=A0A8H7NS34_9APHY|nr:hypothetical protein IEO21_10721 [Postia placenta]